MAKKLARQKIFIKNLDDCPPKVEKDMMRGYGRKTKAPDYFGHCR